MLEALKPLENLLNDALGPGPLRQAVFEIFRFIHLYLPEYGDYLLFGLLFVPLSFLIPRAFKPHYMLLASVLMIKTLFGGFFTLGLMLIPLAIYGLVEWAAARWPLRHPQRSRARGLIALLVVTLYGLLLARESFEYTPLTPFFELPFKPPLLHWCGVAFMLPKLLHVVFDRLDGRLPKPLGALRFSLFMLFFPILRLGPIERYQVFERDLDAITKQGVGRFDLGYGLWRILLGLAKTAVFTAYLLPFRKAAEADILANSPGTLYLVFLCGALEVYCHFGGYSDIAIGFARLFGLRLSENFYLPFFSTSIAEWWRRWHISLSFWLRDYVYRPLGGAKRALPNALITFTLCGAWHYLAWHYIIWGFLQGFGLAGHGAWRAFLGRQRLRVAAGRSPLWGRLFAFADGHPVLIDTSSALITLHYFCATGFYFILSTDDATLALLRLFTLCTYTP